MTFPPSPIVSADPLRAEVWHVLIADDDPSVQAVTHAALRHIIVAGRPLMLASATTVAEVHAWLATHREPALLLLDIGLDTPDAGLILARQVREVLGNHTVRILLRSGRDPTDLRAAAAGLDVSDVLGKTSGTLQELRMAVIAPLEVYARLTRPEN